MIKLDHKKIKGDKIYKKKVDYVEKTFGSDGKILEAKEKSHFVEINAGFTKFFDLHSSIILDLTKGEMKLLFLIMGNVSYGNDVMLSDLKRFKIFKNNNYRQILKYLTGLFNKRLLYKTQIKGLYKLNHNIAYKGDVQSFKKLLGLDNTFGKDYKYK